MKKVEKTEEDEKTIRLDESPIKYRPNYNKYAPSCNMVFKLEDKELKRIQLTDRVYLRLIDTPNGIITDIRKFYKGFPTKQGVRFNFDTFKKLVEVLKDDIK